MVAGVRYGLGNGATICLDLFKVNYLCLFCRS